MKNEVVWVVVKCPACPLKFPADDPSGERKEHMSQKHPGLAAQQRREAEKLLSRTHDDD